MSYDDRIEAARTLVNQHNTIIGDLKADLIDVEGFIQSIKLMGGTSEDRLSAFSHEDILACLPYLNSSKNELDVQVKPRILARDIANIFRKNKTEEKKYVSPRNVERLSVEELVKCFDPEDSDNSVGTRLKQISKGEKFLVYNDGRNVDVETTVKLLIEIKGGFGGREDVTVNGNVKKVYALGELPENYADENPLYNNRPLRPDGTCDQTGRSWEGVEYSIRQFVRVAIDTGELKINHETSHDVIDMVLELDALKKLRQRYRKSALNFDELEKVGKLPTLKISLGRKRGIFDNGNKISWRTAHGTTITQYNSN